MSGNNCDAPKISITEYGIQNTDASVVIFDNGDFYQNFATSQKRPQKLSQMTTQIRNYMI